MSSDFEPQEQAKDLKQYNKQSYARYSSQIVKYDSPMQVWASYATKVNSFRNTKCILVIYKYANKVKIGYAQKIFPRHPLVRREQDLEINFDLQEVIGVYIGKDETLNIKYNVIENLEIKDVKEMVFKFKEKILVQQWINLYIQMKEKYGKQPPPKELQECRTKIQQFDRYKQDQNIVIRELQEKCRGFASEIKKLEQSLKETMKIVGDLQNQKVQMKDKITKLQFQNKTITEKIEKDLIQTQRKQQECTQLQSKLKQKEVLQSSFKNKQEQLRRSIDTLKLQIQQERSQNIKKQQQTKAQQLKLKGKLQQSQKRVGELTKQNQALKDQLKQRIQEQKRIRQHQSEIVNELKSKITKQAKVIDEFSQKSKEKDTKIDQLEAQIKEKSLQLSRKQQQNAFLRLQSLFVGHALQDYHHHKLFLKDTLQSHSKRPIIRTRLLFRYDPNSKVNFHAYIDNQPNFLLVVKTCDGAFLAGYTESAICPLNNADRSGMIISLTNQQVFQLIQDRKSVTYDDYYIIFGNSEIRLKSLELSVFSNFGISNGFYESKGKGVQALLCNGSREVEIETYQMHRVYFGE